MQRGTLFFFLAVITFGAQPAHAQDLLEIRASAAWSQLMLTGESVAGFGGDVAMGYPLDFGLSTEVRFGYNRHMGKLNFSGMPIMVGAKWEFPMDFVVSPFIVGHAGLVIMGMAEEGHDVSYERFGFNVGGGVQWMALDTLGLSLLAQYTMVINGAGFGPGDLSYLNIGQGMTFRI